MYLRVLETRDAGQKHGSRWNCLRREQRVKKGGRGHNLEELYHGDWQRKKRQQSSQKNERRGRKTRPVGCHGI